MENKSGKAESKTDKTELKGYNPHSIEQEVMEFWQNKQIYEQAAAGKGREKEREGKKKFYYLDGPPYTSGRIHIGHAWGKALRDAVMRYFRMKGFDVWDRPGFDMHGLPTAHKVMEKYGLKIKEDIADFGLAKFTEECKQFALENMNQMINDFKRLGVWMDWNNPYIPLKREFIEGNWWLIKKAQENGYLYEGEKSMAWCRVCATSLAKHELDYQNVNDNSVFVKLKVKEKSDNMVDDKANDGTDDNEYLIVWTTTPWTLPFNMAVMAHPDYDYVKAAVQMGDGSTEVWILAKGLAGSVISAVAEKKFEVLEEIKGADLKGLRYEQPFLEEVEFHQKNLAASLTATPEAIPNVYTVVMSEEYVHLDSGTGLVHCAPGCGPEDFEVGHRNHIPPFNALNQYGIFPNEGMGKLAGFVAKQDDKKFVALLEDKGAVVAQTRVQHEYPHCWRCHNPVIWKTTKQWFFDVESELKDLMIKENQKIKWVPDWAGSRWFDSWLRNLKDNGITRQITWGTPLPIWRCDRCQHYEVVGSIAELEQRAGKENIPEDLHVPYIDEVMWNCSAAIDCDGVMRRIPDVLDVWIDAGTTSWTCLDYPQQHELFAELWPADLILEGKDQIRGWFNLLLVASMVSMKKPSYKAVYMHGFINDSQGRKMSKSLGNIISPYEVIDQYGADCLRFYMIGGANAGLDLNYNFDDMKVKHRSLQMLWNLHSFLVDLAETTGLNPAQLAHLHPDISELGIEERYILSRLHATIKQVTFLFDNYYLDEIPMQCENLLLDLSRTYIQLIREKAHFGTAQDKEAVVYTVFTVLTELLKLLAPIVPFITEKIYQNLNAQFNPADNKFSNARLSNAQLSNVYLSNAHLSNVSYASFSNPLSLHLHSWPAYDNKIIDSKLEQNMELAEQIASGIMAARDKAGIGKRWPLKEAIIITDDQQKSTAVNHISQIIKNQANLKKLIVAQSCKEIKVKVLGNYETIEKEFGRDAPAIIGQLALNSPESIIKAVEKLSWFSLSTGTKSFHIKKDHLIIEKLLPTHFEDASIQGWEIYLDKSVDKELEAEGYAREVVRRAQAMRKNAGLKRTDKIVMFVQCDADVKALLDDMREYISVRVGAAKLKIETTTPARKFPHSAEEKVKGKTIAIMIEPYV